MQIDIYTKSSELPPLQPGKIQHSALMFGALEKSSGSKPYMLVAHEEGRELAHLIIMKRRGTLLPPFIGSRYTIYGEGTYSPHCHNREEIYAAFLEKLFDILDLLHSYIEIKTIEDPRFAYSTLSRHNFTPKRDHRIYISLHSKAPEERLSRTHRSHIRKAAERGVTYRPATTEKEIDTALQLLKNYYKSKVRRPSPNIKILKHLLLDENRAPRPEARLFLVEQKGKIIGCSINTYEGDRASLAFSCGLRKSYPRCYPGIVAVWAAIEDAYRQGCSHIEFLESRTLIGTRSGYKNFLLNFGGKQVSSLRWYHFKWNFINKILRAIYV
jgi:hypothetical protein